MVVHVVGSQALTIWADAKFRMRESVLLDPRLFGLIIGWRETHSIVILEHGSMRGVGVRSIGCCVLAQRIGSALVHCQLLVSRESLTHGVDVHILAEVGAGVLSWSLRF